MHCPLNNVKASFKVYYVTFGYNEYNQDHYQKRYDIFMILQYEQYEGVQRFPVSFQFTTALVPQAILSRQFFGVTLSSK